MEALDSSPFRARNNTASDLDHDPHPYMAVVERLLGKKQADIKWEKYVPHRAACFRATYEPRRAFFLELVGLALASLFGLFALCLKTRCECGSQPTPIVPEIALLTSILLLTTIFVVSYLYCLYRDTVRLFFARERRWTEERKPIRGCFRKEVPPGYGRQLIALQLRKRMEVADKLLVSLGRTDCLSQPCYACQHLLSVAEEWHKFLIVRYQAETWNGNHWSMGLDGHLNQTNTVTANQLIDFLSILDQLIEHLRAERKHRGRRTQVEIKRLACDLQVLFIQVPDLLWNGAHNPMPETSSHV